MQVWIIRNSIISFKLDKEFEGKQFFEPRGAIVKNTSSFEVDNHKPLETRLSQSL